MIIGLSGLIGCGKGTVASILTEQYGFVELSFADTLKDVVSCVFSWPRDMLQGDTPESRQWREQADEWWSEKLGIPNFTPRFALTNIGTDVMRNHFNEEIWVLSLMRKLRDYQQNVVVSDCRFINEIEAVVKSGGITARIRRFPDPHWFGIATAANFEKNESLRFAAKQKMKEFNVHESEYSWVGYEYDYIIENSDTKDSLVPVIHQILNHRVSK